MPLCVAPKQRFKMVQLKRSPRGWEVGIKRSAACCWAWFKMAAYVEFADKFWKPSYRFREIAKKWKVRIEPNLTLSDQLHAAKQDSKWRRMLLIFYNICSQTISERFGFFLAKIKVMWFIEHSFPSLRT